jgi:hypothetical protein
MTSETLYGEVVAQVTLLLAKMEVASVPVGGSMLE